MKLTTLLVLLAAFAAPALAEEIDVGNYPFHFAFVDTMDGGDTDEMWLERGTAWKWLVLDGRPVQWFGPDSAASVNPRHKVVEWNFLMPRFSYGKDATFEDAVFVVGGTGAAAYTRFLVQGEANTSADFLMEVRNVASDGFRVTGDGIPVAPHFSTPPDCGDGVERNEGGTYYDTQDHSLYLCRGALSGWAEL